MAPIPPNVDDGAAASGGGGTVFKESSIATAAAVPLSASALSFSPPHHLNHNPTVVSASPTTSRDASGTSSISNHSNNNSMELLNPTTLWGTIGQSTSRDGAATGVGTTTNTNHHQEDSNNSTTLGGLWNFGGFDVDALTNENHNSNTASSSSMMMMTMRGTSTTATTTAYNTINNVTGHRHRHHPQEDDISGSLSSAFGNFGLQQTGPSSMVHHHHHPGGGGGGAGSSGIGMNQPRSQHQGSSGHLLGAGGGAEAGLYENSHPYPIRYNSRGGGVHNEFGLRANVVADHERNALQDFMGFDQSQAGQQQQLYPGMIGYGNQGQEQGGEGYGGGHNIPSYGAPPHSSSHHNHHHHHWGGGGHQGNRHYAPGTILGTGSVGQQGPGGYSGMGGGGGSGGYSSTGTPQGSGGGGGMMSVPAGPPLPGTMGSISHLKQQQQLTNSSNDGLSGPYPPSFPSGGGGSGNGGVISAYHQGPGWDQLPRWGGGGAQMSYGSASSGNGGYGSFPTSSGGGGGGSGGNVGYGGGGAMSGSVAGGGSGSGGRPSYPPYPMPPAENQSTAGGYEEYPSTGYNPSTAGVGGGGGGGVIGGGGGAGGFVGGGGGRNIPSFTPPSYYENESTPTSASIGGVSNVPSGPYPPSFQAGDYGNQGHGRAGTGALSSVLQASYNPQLSAQQMKYPAILGGTSDRAHLDSGSMGDKSPINGIGEGVGASLVGLDGPKRVTHSTASSGNISPASIVSGETASVLSSVGTTGANLVGASTGGGTPRNTTSSFVPGGSGAIVMSTTGSGFLLSPGVAGTGSTGAANDAPILPKRIIPDPSLDNYDDDDINMRATDYHGIPIPSSHDSLSWKRDWLLAMNATLDSTPIGQLDPNILPLSTIMNGWAKQKSSEGARMVEMWLDRVHSEYNAENPSVHPTARMYTMAVDAWAKSNGGAPAARRAEALLERMDRLYREGGGRHEALKPTTGIFNAVINVSCDYPLVFFVAACLSQLRINPMYCYSTNLRHGPALVKKLPPNGRSKSSLGWKRSVIRVVKNSIFHPTSIHSTLLFMRMPRVVQKKVQRRLIVFWII